MKKILLIEKNVPYTYFSNLALSQYQRIPLLLFFILLFVLNGLCQAQDPPDVKNARGGMNKADSVNLSRHLPDVFRFNSGISSNICGACNSTIYSNKEGNHKNITAL